MKKSILFIFSLLIILSFNVSPLVVFDTSAQGLEGIKTETGKFGKTSYGEEYVGAKALPQRIGGVISYGLGALGVILVIMITYGGFLYMTAGGDETRIKKAKALIVQSIIGLMIAVSAYVISAYVVNRISQASTSTPVDTSSTTDKDTNKLPSDKNK